LIAENRRQLFKDVHRNTAKSGDKMTGRRYFSAAKYRVKLTKLCLTLARRVAENYRHSSG